MSKFTPRNTPLAFTPPARRASQPPASVLRPLLGPILVTCGNVSQELRSGSLLIGRLAECDLMLDEVLVSRMHARLLVTSEGVTLEDLHSTNGVYVNGDRITQAAALNVGDRALIGSQEISFSEIGTDPAPNSSFNLEEPRTSPIVETSHSGSKPGAIPITTRADALQLLGTMARRLANEHKAEQAPRMLGPHLRGILRGAGSGLVVPEALSTLASEYALDLAHWTADPRWLDYVVELHLVTKRLFSAPILAALQRAERWVGPLNRSLLEYYVAACARMQLDRDEKARLALVKRILKKK
jgi:pSer/pThr/pTyr-binding forkhead associated (FHA) protein